MTQLMGFFVTEEMHRECVFALCCSESGSFHPGTPVLSFQSLLRDEHA